MLGSKNIYIVDSRSSILDKEKGKADYTTSHIKGAVFFDLEKELSGEIISGITGRHPLPAKNVFADILGSKGANNTMQYVVYDDGHGGIAARFWWMMRWLGHEAVAVLDGGWKSWVELGLDVSSGIESRSPSVFNVQESLEYVVDAEYVRGILFDNRYQLIDARTADRFAGQNENIDPIAGHIKSAVNKPFLSNIGEDGYWKSDEQLKEGFIDYLDKEELICYCGSGVTACHNILALNKIGKKAKLYPGSWSEWITDAERI